MSACDPVLLTNPCGESFRIDPLELIHSAIYDEPPIIQSEQRNADVRDKIDMAIASIGDAHTSGLQLRPALVSRAPQQRLIKRLRIQPRIPRPRPLMPDL